MESRCEVTRTSCVKLAHTRTRGHCLIMSLYFTFSFEHLSSCHLSSSRESAPGTFVPILILFVAILWIHHCVQKYLPEAYPSFGNNHRLTGNRTMY